MATMSARYTVINGEVIAQERSGVRHQLVPDPLGSTIALYDDSGTKTDSFQYWPYGESAGRTGTTIVKFQYVGSYGYYTNNNNQFYIRTDYLDSLTTRMLTHNGINSYIYQENNPIKNIYKPLNASGNKIYFELEPGYGKYCGPQTRPGVGEGEDDIDDCCKVHDEGWAKQCPPCTLWNQLFRNSCKSSNRILCQCLHEANCNKWLFKPRWKRCTAARSVAIFFACSPLNIVPLPENPGI